MMIRLWALLVTFGVVIGCSSEPSGAPRAAPKPVTEAAASEGLCKEHGVLEAICTKCNPQLIPVFQAKGDWCAEHEIPESICTKCNKALIADFKKKGDWCKEHDLPESHCTICNPELKEKFAAMKPKEGK